jgi:hypothetical protein
MKIDRNDPCPCGSGKKYKHCCLISVTSVNSDLKELLASREFDSLEEVQAVADELMEKQNHQPQDDFLGLSSEHVFRMLNFTFETPELYQFSELFSTTPKAPILILIENIASTIDEKGLKATAKGNLPQKLCRDAWSHYCELNPDDDRLKFHKVNKEDDFFEFHVTRIILELAGFLRKTKGRFFLTRKFQKVFSQSGLRGLYPIIFKIYCTEFNWAYWDRYSEVPFIQQSFLFTMYLLKHHGKKWALNKIYEDDFLKAFPMVVNEMEESAYSSPEEDVRRCYFNRAIKRFLVFFGLAKIEMIKDEKLSDHKYKIKKTQLLEDIVIFNLIDPDIQKKVNSSIVSPHLH